MEERRSEKILRNILAIALVVLLGWSLCYILMDSNKGEKNANKEIKKQLDRIEEVLYKLEDGYTGEIDYEKAGTAALASILYTTDDPYTRYLDKKEFEDTVNAGLEEYGGVGVHLIYDKESNNATVVSAMPDTPAHKAGIEMGDKIIKVEDIEVKSEESYLEAAEKLRGEPNTKVNITISRKGEIIEKTLTREIIKVSNVNSNMLSNNIGYIKIVAFENKVYDEFRAEYQKLQKQNMKGLIIDLRNNPGGMVDETVKIVDMLVKDGDVILKTKYKNGDEKIKKGKDGEKTDIPIIVLVNGQSASASEILASALKDYNVATLMGEKTFGKGIVQGIEMLQNGDGISITIAKYYTKNGAEIHKKGIEPDIKVEIPEEEKNKIVLNQDNDTLLKKAVEEMNKKIK